jgi:endonuclease YncB( thermonuclease family)
LGKVVDAYDGDTCRVAFHPPGAFSAPGGPRVDYIQVRMLGYDAPEMKKTKGLAHRPYGEEVRNAFRALVLHKIVAVAVSEEERDPYGRALAHLYVAASPSGPERSVEIRGQRVAIPATADVPLGHPLTGQGLRELIHVNRWMIEHGRVKVYDGGGARPEWTAEELLHGIT